MVNINSPIPVHFSSLIPRMLAAMGGAGSVAKRSYPTPKVRGATESTRLGWRRSGQEELLHARGQGRQLRGATPCPRSEQVAERSYPMPEVQ